MRGLINTHDPAKTLGMLYKDDPDYYPVGGRMRWQWVIEIKDGKVTAHTEEHVKPAKWDDWSAKSTPARTLPNGGRTIRPEQK